MSFTGAKVSEFELTPLLYKRLRIQGSTLRSRTMAYQADLIRKWVWFLSHSPEELTSNFSRFTDDVLGSITGEDGQGPIKTYIHKVRESLYPFVGHSRFAFVIGIFMEKYSRRP